MGSRSPNAGAPTIRRPLFLARELSVSCETPEAGPGYHVCTRLSERIGAADWSALEAAIGRRDSAAVEHILQGSPAASWWARARPVLARAWPSTPEPAATLWQAVGVPQPTLWSLGEARTL